MTKVIRVNTGNSWAILRDIILRNTASRSESYITPIKGFEFHRQVSNADPKPHFYEPVIIVVVQGKKLVKIGAEEHHYGENICFVCGVDMPVSSCVMEASEEAPYLSMSLKLDTGLIASLASHIPHHQNLFRLFRQFGQPHKGIQQVRIDFLRTRAPVDRGV